MEFAIKLQHLIENMRNPFFDILFQAITKFGEELIIFGFICVFYWCIHKETAYTLGLSFFASGTLMQGLKVTFTIERPFVIDPTLKPVGGALEHATGYSFPSGHTQGGTTLFGFLATKLSRWWARVLCILAFLLVGFSRMYLGVHTVYDVGVSLILAFVTVFLISRFSGEILSGKHDLSVSVTLGSLSVLLCVYSLILALVGHAALEQINDCFKSGGAGLAFAIGFLIERKYIKFDPKGVSLPLQAAKLAVGILGALAFKSGIKLIAPGNLAIDFIRYFLTILWVVAIYPYIFSKFFEQKVKKSKIC